MILDILLCHFYMVRFYALPLFYIPNTERIKMHQYFQYIKRQNQRLRLILMELVANTLIFGSIWVHEMILFVIVGKWRPLRIFRCSLPTQVTPPPPESTGPLTVILVSVHCTLLEGLSMFVCRSFSAILFTQERVEQKKESKG